MVICLTLPSCKKESNRSGTGNTPQPIGQTYPKTVSIEYRVTVASGDVSKITSLTYTNETGGGVNQSDVALPFSKKISATVNKGDDFGLSLLHNNSATGAFELKMDIMVDGNIIKTETHGGTSSVIAAIVHFFP